MGVMVMPNVTKVAPPIVTDKTVNVINLAVWHGAQRIEEGKTMGEIAALINPD
jgi:hypothetical protein